MTHDFLLELVCEELPSCSVWPLAESLTKQLTLGLDEAQLSYGEVKTFATPRRIAVAIGNVSSEQPSQTNTRRGPAAIAAYDAAGKPTQALLGFAKSCGVELEQLSTIQTDKGEWIVCTVETIGKPTPELLPSLVKKAIANLPIAKPMRWGATDDEFVRPVHQIVLLFGNEVVHTELLGVKTGNSSRGHRFHHSEILTISHAKEYEQQMRQAFVWADFASRRDEIVRQIEQLASSQDATAVMPPELLDEVTSIVEWPQALIAGFEKEFLEVPAEALIASMQAHQKCFALKDRQGKLLPFFITVANIISSNPKQVILGNEKVMRARLSDAAFFFNQDKKHALETNIAGTKQVVFQTKLGTLYDKTERIKKLMSYLASVLKIEPVLAARASDLCKCDLLSGMVGEFPELQGLMGFYYALNDGEDRQVAQALNEQYLPRFAADELPESLLGKALSLADRLDTLVGIFSIGLKPSGVKDPFKLRRHALAVIRLLISLPLALNLSDLIAEAAKNYSHSFDANLLTELKAFILERLSAYYQAQGITTDLVLAVRARQDENLYDLNQRVQALKLFITLPQAASLSAACKRVDNLLQHASLSQTRAIQENLLEVDAEKSLYFAINELSLSVGQLYQSGDYGQLLKQLAGIKQPIDAFFDEVMVMVDNEALKNNRLNLLASLAILLQGVADISLLQLS